MSRLRMASLALAACALVAGGLFVSCSRRAVVIDPGLDAPPPADPIDTFHGKATWYGGRFQGRKTASGEPFDREKLTAAHRKLPFGSVVRVVNVGNGRSVLVRINDRGPFGKGRIIDVSEAAARKLHMIDAGVVTVRVEVMSVPE